ncbi:hypothetical protein ASG60_00135 [Methylobacterium sp. Leaf469]|uniref:TrbI/VirB10 family protein n=1 Tax=Methylobacterium sp. Leaf469 TaxID=1736387 RepID=UPI0007002F80|nr:TrbI/VirB10 family protein [Methylobacterium sp. Leaf469]KQU05145.1 hypothetical protein ASG60_00135 [Methylobacterium sp. Leaf469]
MPSLVLALGFGAALAGATPDATLLIRVQAEAPAGTVQAPTGPVQAPAGPVQAPASLTQSSASPVQPPPQAAMPFTQGSLPGQAPAAPSVVYQGPPGQALSDPAIEARINAQIEALMAPPSGGFTLQRYGRAEGAGGGGISGAGPTRSGGSPAPSGGTPIQQANYPQAGAQPGGFGGAGGGGQSGSPGGSAGPGGAPGPAGYGGGSQGQGGYPGQNAYPGQGGYPGQGAYPGQAGPNGQFGGAPVRRYAVARAGDTVYASLDQGFNSDDPQAPIFATIYDVDGAQRPGPLHGVRLIGQIVYSSNQAAIQFSQMVLNDGRQFPLKAYAISARDARTGVSNDVDQHVFERYAGLFAGALIQGAGQAGQLLLQGNRNIAIDPGTGLAVSSQGGGIRTQAAIGALLPLGQAATAIGAQNFNKPATIAGAPGMGIGVVFLEPPALPRDAVYGSGRSERDTRVRMRAN